MVLYKTLLAISSSFIASSAALFSLSVAIHLCGKEKASRRVDCSYRLRVNIWRRINAAGQELQKQQLQQQQRNIIQQQQATQQQQQQQQH